MRIHYHLMVGVLAWAGCAAPRAVRPALELRPVVDRHEEEGHDEEGHDARAALGWRLDEGWLDEHVHSHASRAGTPYVHAFLTEPAFLGRELLVGYAESGSESAVEAELEWALTRRLGLVVEGAWLDTGTTSGFGDSVVALRGLLAEHDRLLLALTGEVGVPTGSARKGTGGEAWGFGGILNAWVDLGHWVTLQTSAGIERVSELGETAFVWSAAVTKSFPVRPLIARPADEPTILALHAEIAGETGLSSGSGSTEGQWLLGVTYPVAAEFDVRAGYTRDFRGRSGWTVGFVRRF